MEVLNEIIPIKKLYKNKRLLIYAVYKPRNCITTLHDPEGRDTIINYFPATTERLLPIGRLDYSSEGLLLLTNQGSIINEVLHPKQKIWKKYFY